MYYNNQWYKETGERDGRYRSRDFEDFYRYPMSRGFGGGYGRGPGPGAYYGAGRRHAYGYGMGPGRFFGWCPYPPTRYW